ncbi:MAG: hypothetical protein IJE78_06995 [Bacteroidaceae bacterium]|nr:hypothetical protein [Bacteroidaceae bacterium]
MKNFKILSMLLTIILFMSCSGSGSDEIPELEKPEPEKAYTVSLNLGGEYMSTSESPLSRTENAVRYYGINVYYKDDNSTSWKHYAYGLFDNTNDMTISLIASYKYKFVCTMTEDNKDHVYYQHYSDTGNKGFRLPFCKEFTSGVIQTILDNKFHVSTTSETHLPYINGGKTTIGIGDQKDYPRIDRFYGELSDYVPSENNAPTIDLKRVAFGIKVVATAPSDGKLTLSNDELGTITQISSEDGNHESEAIYTFKDVYKCWAGTTTEQEFTLTLTWKRENGASQEFTKKVTVKRNVMTTINIDVTSTTASNTLKFNIDSTPMESETINWKVEA